MVCVTAEAIGQRVFFSSGVVMVVVVAVHGRRVGSFCGDCVALSCDSEFNRTADAVSLLATEGRARVIASRSVLVSMIDERNGNVKAVRETDQGVLEVKDGASMGR